MKLVWTPSSKRDLDHAVDQLASIDEDLAERLLTDAANIALFLLSTPRGGAPVANGFRKLRLASSPYLVIYGVAADRVTIYRLMHVRSDWASLA